MRCRWTPSANILAISSLCLPQKNCQFQPKLFEIQGNTFKRGQLQESCPWKPQLRIIERSGIVQTSYYDGISITKVVQTSYYDGITKEVQTSYHLNSRYFRWNRQAITKVVQTSYYLK